MADIFRANLDRQSELGQIDGVLLSPSISPPGNPLAG